MFNPRVLQKLHQVRIAGAIFHPTTKVHQTVGEDSKAMLTPRLLRRGWQVGIAVAFGISGAIFSGSQQVFAQVTTDGSLGTRVTPNGTTFQITGGTPAGRNLFHSFGSFSVPNGGTATFLNAPTFINIFGRVTGGTPSDIQGLIRAQGSANLFLMNPSGIIFGQNAELRIGGSFVATTANAIEFPNGGVFSNAINSPVARGDSLLRVNPSAFLFNQITPGSITNQSTSGLRVLDGKSLYLLGGNVILDGGAVRALGGRIELGGLAGTGRVGLGPNNDGRNLILNFPDGVVRADVSIINGAIIDVVGDRGNLAINARNINVSGRSKVCAGIGTTASSCGTPGSGSGSANSQAGNIVFGATGTVSISGQGTRIESDLNPGTTGNSGDIFDAIINRDNIFGSIIIGGESISVTDGATVSTSSFGQGSAGLVILAARGQVFADNANLFSNMSSGGTGNAGGVLIEASSISLNNSQLRVQTRGTGEAGIVSLKAEGGPISLNNTRIFSDVLSGANGNARGVVIEAGSLSAINSGISSSTFGDGNAGAVIITIDGSASFVDSSLFSNVESGGVGEGGKITLTAGSLFLLDGSQLQTIVRGEGDDGTPAGDGNAGEIAVIVRDAFIGGVDAEGFPSLISSSSLGQGNAGLVRMVAIEDITLVGDPSRSFINVKPGILSSVEPGGVGTAGGVLVVAGGTVFVRDGAEITVRNLGEGDAGVIGIFARDLLLLNQGLVTAVTLSGEGGDILLGVQDLLVLLRTSDISTTSGSPLVGGNGGNMQIQAGYVFGVPTNDSNITAQAFAGDGGNIQINTSRLYSLGKREDDFLNTNDITASSRLGLDGLVEANVLDIDPTQGLTNLPETPIDPTSQIAQACPARDTASGQEVNKFTVVGREGLPQSPNDTLQNESVITNWTTLDPPAENSTQEQSPTQPENSAPTETPEESPAQPENSAPTETPEENSTENDNPTQPESNAPTETRVAKTPTYVEAQGWVISEKGEVILTAKADTPTPHNPTPIPVASCNGS